MSFLEQLQQNTNETRTENNAVTNKSSLNACLDFFSLAGAMRDRPEDVGLLFEKAFATDKLTAIRTLFYLRDVRGGQGERQSFRVCLEALQTLDREVHNKVIKHVPEYGRWDDLFCPATNAVIQLVENQLEKDVKDMEEGNQVSLLAKWLPSENTSSKLTQAKAKAIAKALDLKPAQYRKKIVSLRKHIKLLEQKMSTKQWSDVDYSKVPSQALRKHVKAFKRNDGPRYEAYLESVEKGEAKINTSTLFTYEVFDAVSCDEQTANVMWDNLPNYVEHDALVVADVSGSMMGRPMSISVSLALYFAERNKGLMAGYFMTFSAEPQLIKVVGKKLVDKLRYIENADWGMNTDLEAVFDKLLDAAQTAETKQDDMPKVVYIISDMEFDECVSCPDETIFNNAKQKFAEKGLSLPHIVFWNVDARQNQAPATKFDNNVTLISGSSQSTFRYAVEGKNPEESMNDIINSERYAPILI